MKGLPQDFVEEMSRQLQGELSAFLHAYEEPYLRGLRLNPGKRMNGTGAIPGVLSRVPWQANGCYLSQDSIAGAMPLHEAGAYYLQEPSAMLPARVLYAFPGETVLDLCAAPGGKATQLASYMAGKGLLVCNEPSPKRAQVLSRNIERMGVTNALVVSALPEKLAERWHEGFDAVLVDAPCSGEGMFRRHPETRMEWSIENRDGCAKRQAEILDSAARLVRPGGRLVYATCTLNHVENEDTVNAFCSRHPDFAPEPFALPGADAPSGMLTCYPHRMKGEGQFACRMRRKGEDEAVLPPDTSLPKPDKAALQALRAFCPDAPAPTAMLGDTMVYLPGCPDVRGIKVLRAGLHLASVRGKVVQPDHAWAVSTCPPPFPRFTLSEEQAIRYLLGETLEVDEHLRGYVLPTLCGLPLGWGKASGGVMKNHYPKGLRRPCVAYGTEKTGSRAEAVSGGIAED